MTLHLDASNLTVVSTDGSYFGVSSAYLVDLSKISDDEVTDWQEGTDRERCDFALSRGIPLEGILNGDEPVFVSQFVLYKFEAVGYYGEYCYVIPHDTGSYWMIDCWIVNEKGEKHPGYDVAPVPFATSGLEPVGDSPWMLNEV